MNKYKEISYNTVIFAIGNIGIKLIQFFLLPLLTVKLSTSDYNTADLLTSTLELILPLMTLGLAESVFRFGIKTDYNKKSIFSNSLLIALSGIILVVLGVCVINFIYPQNFWFLFSALYALSALDNIINSYIRGLGKVKTFAFTGIVQALCLAGFSLIFVYILGYGLIGYLIAMILAYGVRIVAMFIFGQVYKYISIKSLDKKLLKIMVLYALPMIPNNISWWLVHAASKYICTGFLGAEVAGLYAAASKLPALINMLATIFLQAWSISTAKSIEDEDKGRFNTMVFRYLSAFVLCCAAAVFVILPYISKFLLQGEFYEGWRYSALLIFAAVLTCYSSYFGAFYGANFNTKMVFVSTLAGAVVNVAVSFALIWWIGIYALLLSSCITYAVIVIIRMATTKKYSLIKINYFKEGLSLAIVLSQALIITFLGAKWWLQLILFVALLIVRSKDIIELCKNMLGLLRRKKSSITEENINVMKELSLREMQFKELDMLVWVDNFCRENGLKYSLIGGTMLGAVRHGGFIPWDDDIDLGMPRPDYEKFYSLISGGALPDYYSYTEDRGDRAKYPYIKIIDKNVFIRSEIGEATENLWIDIMPVDGYPRDDKEALKFWKKVRKYRRIILYNYSICAKAKGLKKIALKAYSVYAKLYGTRRAVKKIRKMIEKYPYETSPCVGVVAWGMYGIGERMPRGSFENIEEVNFEDKKAYAICNRLDYLTGIYGDYMRMPPEEKRHTHSFKAFLKDDRG